MSLREHYENLDQYTMYDYKDVANAYGHGEWDAIDKVLYIYWTKYRPSRAEAACTGTPPKL